MGGIGKMEGLGRVGFTLRARGGEIVVWGSGRGKCRLLLAWRWRVAEGKCSMERCNILLGPGLFRFVCVD